MILNSLPWKQTEIILSFLRLHPSTAFRTLVDHDGIQGGLNSSTKDGTPTPYSGSTKVLLIIGLPEKFPQLSFSSVQFISVAQSCPILCDPMNRSTPGLPVHHQLPEFTQTHVHRVSDAIQPSHPLSSPSPPAPNPSQHQSLFQ